MKGMDGLVSKCEYSWIQVGDIEVRVDDLEFDEDETAIMQQIYAMGMKWA